MADQSENMVVVTDNGFVRDERAEGLMNGSYGELTASVLAGGLPVDGPAKLGLLLTPGDDDDIDALRDLLATIDLVIIPFAKFSDGRGFSLATRLRRLGYRGRIRAHGHLISDQYAHARRCGFDEVAITASQALRQPESQWLAQVPRINTTYQKRLAQLAEVA